MLNGAFKMVKWYQDCVNDAGDAAIVYGADVRWRAVHASMGSVLEARSGTAPCTRTSLGGFDVALRDDEISVEHKRLKVSGTWRGFAPSTERTVYEEPGGSIVWSCLQPASHVELRIADRAYTGLGYAERLTLMLPSWRLPIRSLRWGRFVCEDRSLAWVDWMGEYTTRFAILDGQACPLQSVSESEIVTYGATLKIYPGESLRSGKLSSTILSGAPGLKRLFPASLFNIREKKWKSRGELSCCGQAYDGWVIHEVVEWEP